MKKILSTFAFLCFVFTAYAQTYSTFTTPGGLSSSTKIGTTSQTLGDVTSLANGAIPLAQKGAADGVASLGTNGDITAPISSDKAVISSNGANIVELKNQRADPLLGADTLLFGGVPIGQVNAAPIGTVGTSSPISINAAPFGNYNNGCVLCIAMNAGTFDDGAGRAAVTQGDWRGGVSAVETENAFVGFQSYVDNAQARLVLPVAYYTTTGVVLKTALTAAQIALIRPGMYVAINSIDTDMADDTTDTAAGNLPNSRFYQSYTGVTPVSSDGLTINIVGWAAPYSGNTASGQQPHPTQAEYAAETSITADLDTEYSNYTYPVVMLGAGNKTFGRNLFVNYDASRQGSGVGKNNATSVIRRVEGEEMDLNLFNLPGNDAVQVRGLTITTPNQSMCANGVSACGATADSYALRINTELPTGIEDRCGSDCVPFYGDSFWFHGNKGVQTIGTTTPVTSWEMAELSAYVDSTDNARLLFWLSKDQTATTGIDGASMHIGYHDGGTAGSGLTDWGSVVFNEQGTDNGGASLCGGTASSTVSCGLRVDYNNIAYAPNGIQVLAGTPMAMIPSSGDSSGHPYFYAKSSSSLAFKTSAGGTANISAGSFTEALTTPASSSAACTTGQFTDDANYHYVCVATNTWKRVALSSF